MMKRLINLIPALLIAYVLLIGGLFNSMVNVDIRGINLILLGATGLLWLIGRRGQRWKATPLDSAIIVWGAAFILSLLSNGEMWRRSAISLWHVGLYILLWYMLSDLLARRVIKRKMLVDGILIAGGMAILLAWMQVYVTVILLGEGLPRPGGIYGNPNTLAGLLMLVLPLSAWQLWQVRSAWMRVIMGVYLIAGLVLLGVSFSRGGWAGLAGGIVIAALLSASVRGKLLARWRAFTRKQQFTVGVALFDVVVIVGSVVLYSLGIGGRTIDRRTFLYDTAFTMISEKPITGHGLFTFGLGLSRLNSLPPESPHTHAHNIILHVGAELGVIGIAALMFTAWRMIQRRGNDSLANAALIAFACYSVHQLFDVPSMMPSIAIGALIVAAILLSEGDPLVIVPPAPRWSPIRLMIPLWAALLIVGGYATSLYSQYVNILSGAGEQESLVTTANLLAAEAVNDPQNPLYANQSGLLLAMHVAEQTDDTAALAEAIRQYEQYTLLEPYQAAGWANLAALYAQQGDTARAYEAISHAQTLAYEDDSLAYTRAVYAELNGEANARELYSDLISETPEISLIPAWGTTALQRDIPINVEMMSPFAQVVMALVEGDISTAQALWDAAPQNQYHGAQFINAWLAYYAGDQQTVQRFAQMAAQNKSTASTQAWGALALALVAEDEAAFNEHVEAARNFITTEDFEADWVNGANIAYGQWISLVYPRQFIPQARYINYDFELLYILEHVDSLRE